MAALATCIQHYIVLAEFHENIKSRGGEMTYWFWLAYNLLNI